MITSHHPHHTTSLHCNALLLWHRMLAEAASDARYMHDMLRKMLRAPVFIDSVNLNDLRSLITECVHKSDTLVLLATKGVLSRHWCLLELLETARKGIPAFIVKLANGGFDIGNARMFVMNLEEEMHLINPGGLEFLRQRIGQDLDELKSIVLRVLDAYERFPLVFDSTVASLSVVAAMKDIVERMAYVTGRKVEWEDEPPRKKARANLPSRLGRLNIRRMSIDLPVQAMIGESAVRRYLRHTESSILVSCSRKGSTLAHARVLCSALAVKQGRGCQVGGTVYSKRLLHKTELCVVLLTKQILTDPITLSEIYEAILRGLPLVTVVIAGAGYDYEDASRVFTNLAGELEKSAPGSFDAMLSQLPAGTTGTAVGEKLYHHLTAIIALSWSPSGSKNQLDALISDILKRMPDKRKSARS